MIDLTHQPQLFLDDHLAARSDGVRREVLTPLKHLQPARRAGALVGAPVRAVLRQCPVRRRHEPVPGQ